MCHLEDVEILRVIYTRFHRPRAFVSNMEFLLVLSNNNLHISLRHTVKMVPIHVGTIRLIEILVPIRLVV